ncbi:MAG TPA: hypothetical protein VH858_11775 [Hyphomicrobiales bacterium]
MQDHVPGGRRGRTPQELEPDADDLDYQLSRALDRAARRHRAAGKPNQPPIAPLTARNPYVSMQPVPVPLPPHGAKKPGSGVRNVVAISLSVAVVGLAFHQISSQWSESRNSGAKTEEASIVADTPRPAAPNIAASVSSPPAEQAPKGVKASGNRVDLRPSLADATANSGNADAANSDRQALYAEMEQAVKSYLERENGTKAAPAQTAERVAASTAAQSGSEEAMLRRGRELMDRGHVSGARLIFEHLAEQNSALGAFALAQTYDARYLTKNGLTGASPDDKLAAHWYQRAVELGSGG